MLALSLSDKFCCFGIFVFVFNRFLFFSFSFCFSFHHFFVLVLVFANENHTGLHADRPHLAPVLSVADTVNPAVCRVSLSDRRTVQNGAPL